MEDCPTVSRSEFTVSRSEFTVPLKNRMGFNKEESQ